MVYVRLIREGLNRTTCETLNLHHGTWRGVGIDRIILSENPIETTSGIRVTKEDFNFMPATSRFPLAKFPKSDYLVKKASSFYFIFPKVYLF